jgi:hypothetical protein
MAGYSKRSLAAKLGLKPGFKVYFVNAPENYAETLGNLPADLTLSRSLEGPLDFIQFFTKDKAELQAGFPGLKQALAPAGMLWISWPKKASKVKTDLDENIIREIGLAHGLVDVKVAAVDATWSGLKFIYRLKDRT